MKSIVAIAQTTFRELIREKLFIVIFFIAVLLLLLSVALSNLSIWEFQRILSDFSLSSMEIAGLGIVLFTGSFMIHREIEKQTCLLLLSKPIKRSDFIIGKFIGLSVLILLMLAVLTVMLNMILMKPEFIVNSLFIMINIYLKLLVVLSLVFFFSVYVRPIFSLIFGLSFYFYGHGINSVEFLIQKTKDQNLIFLQKALENISPQFFRFNWKNYYFLQEAPTIHEFCIMAGYFLIWIIFLMILAIHGFNRKDIV